MVIVHVQFNFQVLFISIRIVRNYYFIQNKYHHSKDNYSLYAAKDQIKRHEFYLQLNPFLDQIGVHFSVSNQPLRFSPSSLYPTS